MFLHPVLEYDHPTHLPAPPSRQPSTAQGTRKEAAGEAAEEDTRRGAGEEVPGTVEPQAPRASKPRQRQRSRHRRASGSSSWLMFRGLQSSYIAKMS